MEIPQHIPPAERLERLSSLQSLSPTHPGTNIAITLKTVQKSSRHTPEGKLNICKYVQKIKKCRMGENTLRQ